MKEPSLVTKWCRNIGRNLRDCCTVEPVFRSWRIWFYCDIWRWRLTVRNREENAIPQTPTRRWWKNRVPWLLILDRKGASNSAFLLSASSEILLDCRKSCGVSLKENRCIFSREQTSVLVLILKEANKSSSDNTNSVQNQISFDVTWYCAIVYPRIRTRDRR